MMSKIRLILFAFLIFSIAHSAVGQDSISLSKTTYVYSIKGNDTLRLDKYEPEIRLKTKSPVVIFVFGGGFISGARDVVHYMPYFKLLTENGYTVFSIDYRLGFQRIPDTQGKRVTPKQFLEHFNWTIQIAVEDLFDATAFVLNHVEEWNLDPDKIIASGSSAGAITVLQGAYDISTGGEYVRHLPESFNYAGVISFAGAIYSTKGKLKWTQKTAPIQLFHGAADMNVPYDKLTLGRKGFFGSKNITERLEKENLPFYFYAEQYSDHKLSVAPTIVNQQEILSFLDKYVDQGWKTNTVVTVNSLEQKNVKRRYTIIDYVNANFRPQKVKKK